MVCFNHSCASTSRDGQRGDVRFGDWNGVSAGYYPRVVSDPRINPPSEMTPHFEFSSRTVCDQHFNPQVGYSQQVGYGQQVGFPPAVAYHSRYHPYNFRPEQATGHCFTASANQQWRRFPTPGTASNTSAFVPQGRLCYVCSKPGHIKKNCPKLVQPVCYFCNEQGHKYTDCLQRKTWQDSSAGLDEFERLCSIRILDNSGVKLTPPSNEFRDFKTFTAKIFKKYAQQCGAVCVTPQGIPDYSLKIGELAKEKVCPHIQEYEQHSEEEFRDMHNPDNKMNGINTCQLLLGHAMSYTGWHVENVNLPSINYHHSGKPKYWVVVAEKYGVLLKEFFRKNIPSFYKECRSAELYATTLKGKRSADPLSLLQAV
ncbi:hypothetical protein OUZ56_032256 [Daphnia magna]|uniref:CCHC-type domain-containing protein n=1 Tax=Daphnia magna TaxID=35525 RepID=A0ABQ9ZWN1_9CRUS|nr:hypothetical protein OUZ56_032256 [Daphnia magna]